ncbi:MAG: hypothetical protein ACREB9_08475 [Thermoplasmata archaeon]
MRRLTLAAILSLAGLVLAIGLYSIDPLPAGGIPWEDPSVYGSLALLVVGLLCFLVALPTGLITVLNWNSDRGSERRP